MDADDKVFVLCLSILRWLGLSFTGAKTSPSGYLVAVHSKLHFFLNLIVAATFSFFFSQINLEVHGPTENVHESLLKVYPLYVKALILSIVFFLLCGNVYNRKFVALINGYKRASRGLVRRSPRKWGTNGFRILVQFIAFIGVMLCAKLHVDDNITLRFGYGFRVIPYVCFCYVTLFAAHFVVTMNYIRETFREVNGALEKMVRREVPTVSGVPDVPLRRKVTEWMEAYMQLREMEPLVNEVFGKQIFLTLALAFSAIIVNIYCIISSNLFGTAHLWLNVSFFIGFFQAVVLAVVSTRAAELATDEANRVNAVIFGIPVDWGSFKLNNQIKYFTLFNYHYPMVFRVWIFYVINYASLFKVILTSSAITTILLQCEFIKRAPEVTQ